MMFEASFSNISAISWQSVLLVEETGVPGENLPQVTDKLYHIMLYRVSPLTGITTPKGSSVIVVLDESITLIALITMRKWVIFKCQAPCTLKKQLAAAPN